MSDLYKFFNKEPDIEMHGEMHDRAFADCSISRIQCGIDNCFLVKQAGHSILVDTSSWAYCQKVLEVAVREDVQLVILTHGHYDHVCNAVTIANELDIPIAMHAADVDLLKDNHLQRMHASTLRGYIELFCVHKMRRRKVPQTFVPDIFVTEGYWLGEFGIDGKVVELPGHTMGSIGIDIWGTDFIAGDAVTSWPSLGPASVYGNRISMEESCAKIAKIGKRMVHCGHGVSVPNNSWGVYA